MQINGKMFCCSIFLLVASHWTRFNTFIHWKPWSHHEIVDFKRSVNLVDDFLHMPLKRLWENLENVERTNTDTEETCKQLTGLKGPRKSNLQPSCILQAAVLVTPQLCLQLLCGNASKHTTGLLSHVCNIDVCDDIKWGVNCYETGHCWISVTGQTQSLGFSWDEPSFRDPDCNNLEGRKGIYIFNQLHNTKSPTLLPWSISQPWVFLLT